MTAVLAVNAENFDHGRLVAGLEALARAVDVLKTQAEYEDGDSIDHGSVDQRLEQIFTEAKTEAKKD